MRIEHTKSADGTTLGWERVGQGPPVLVLHGGTRAGKHYRPLAEALASRFSLLLFDRRGRGETPSAEGAGILEKQVEDVDAVLRAAKVTRVFGHSAGAVIALEAAKRLPIEQLAVFEPPLVEGPVDAKAPFDWVPEFERALARDDTASAFLTLANGLQMGPPGWLPSWAVRGAFNVLSALRSGKEISALLRTLPADVALVKGVDLSSTALGTIRCPTLLLWGTQSPLYLRRSAEELERLVPGARREAIGGAGHNAPDMEAPVAVAEALGRFFGAAAYGA